MIHSNIDLIRAKAFSLSRPKRVGLCAIVVAQYNRLVFPTNKHTHWHANNKAQSCAVDVTIAARPVSDAEMLYW